MRRTVSRYVHTLRHLKPEQLLYQLYYRLVKKVSSQSLDDDLSQGSVDAEPVDMVSWIEKPPSYRSGSYTFLNLKKAYPADGIEWDFSEYGKLWLYNLHYFDYLLQPGLDKQAGLQLIRQYVEDLPGIKVGIEPYPISLRGINWIKLLSLHGIRDEAIDRSLYSQYRHLSRTLEYHLLGNHLLENAFSLLFGAMYFNERKWFEKSMKLLQRELKEQVLGDGGHFELSPMYHQILLDRLLDCINLLKHNHRFTGQERLLGFMKETAGKMLGWLQSITFPDGSVPHVNDATDGIAPSSSEIEAYAHRLGISTPEREALADSGYRRFDREAYCCLADVGAIGPYYIPGHAHADTLNFVLYVDDKPLIVDTGISTYENNEIRQFERSTSAHNTVVVNGNNSSDVWGGFRVGSRAKVNLIEETEDDVFAEHNGYMSIGINHRRNWRFGECLIFIRDELQGSVDDAEARFHFDHALNPMLDNCVITCQNVQLSFKGAYSVYFEIYRQALGFNLAREARCAIVKFSKILETEIRIA